MVKVKEWSNFFLRDDRASNVREDEAYSLFRKEPYGRVIIFGGVDRDEAIKNAEEYING